MEQVLKNLKLNKYAIHLRPSLPEDQTGVIHAISPFWMKLCQIEGTTQQLSKTNCAGFGIFSLGFRTPPHPPTPPPWVLPKIPNMSRAKASNLDTTPAYRMH